nr:RNA-directed DNA polymerase, eukaryota, reverse transcriptase zinc-binding domain protein [Tanacetum cinerariifolium]
MEKIDLWCIKMYWGNFTFDYVYSESVGKSGGILCVWDPNMFQKINDTVSDYFIMVRGVWVSSGKRLLIISVCAPQDLSEKKMLWDYLSIVIGNWDGEVVIVGDFNEVRDITDLDEVIDKGEGLDADVHRRREVVRLIQEAEKVDAMEVAQKAKIKWSIKGDENSKYYHGVLNKKRGRLTIRGVLVDDIWMESPHLVKHEFFEHIKNRFEKSNKSCILLERDFVKRISLEQNDDLERGVSNEEIKRAVWDCGIDKAPGPDGFTFGFDRRPIILIGSLYKVIVKVLANRLVTVLDDIVDEIQSAFVTDRQILDGPFILNEIFHWSGVGDLMSRIQSWHDVTEGMHTQLSKWKLKTLSIGGRLTLLKSVLGAIPIYHMSIFKVPLKVLQNMESIQARFFNGADVNSKKPSWVRWKSVLAAKDVGGLGVSSLFALNRALMFK